MAASARERWRFSYPKIAEAEAPVTAYVPERDLPRIHQLQHEGTGNTEVVRGIIRR